MRVRGIAPVETLFVGDSRVDEEAARAAGTRFSWAHHFFARA
jgi:phosphoglycolate phosphatase-like HAD superfamily hydrolase